MTPSILYLKSQIGETLVKNTLNNTIFTLNSSDKVYQKVMLTQDTFQIQIPNDKPTNRILVYQTNNNKLLHITDYILHKM